MREETKYIVIHCSQTRPSMKDVDAKWIDRLHRGNGWLKIKTEDEIFSLCLCLFF